MRATYIAATLVLASGLSIAPQTVLAADGLITGPSKYSVDATIERFETAVKKRGFVVFARLDHAAAADVPGMKTPRATVIVFGNPRLGTPVFIKTPTVAIDLLPKAMVWEDADGRVYPSYNSSDSLFMAPSTFATAFARTRGVVEAVESASSSVADETVK